MFGEEMVVKKIVDEGPIQVEHPLVPLEKFLEAGVHIGSKFRSGHMKKFIYKCRNDGLCVLDITLLNERIGVAAKFLARFEPDRVLIVAGRNYAQKPAKKMAELIGAHSITGRFIPGSLTNPNNENFVEPLIVFAGDPPVDRQVIKEAVIAKVPVVSLCDTSNLLRNIDLVIPTNNKGKKALALIYWLLTREILKERGTIKSDSEFDASIEDFETRVDREVKERFAREEFRRGHRGRRPIRTRR
jgi:small subunit ribosomal protein S2